MNPEVTAALITGVLGLLGIIATLYRDEIKDSLLSVFGRRPRRRIQGTWVGEGNDLDVPPHLSLGLIQEYDVNFQMRQRGQKIAIDIVISLKDRSRIWQAEGEGSFISDSYIHIEYHIIVEGSLHFGCVILKISELGNEMTGYYLAKRVVYEGIVFGRVRLVKTSNQ